MQRWALVRGELVIDYLLSDHIPTVEEFNQRAWGKPESVDEEGRDVKTVGDWIEVKPYTLLVGDGWKYKSGAFVAPTK